MPAAYEVEARHASIKFQTVLLDILVFFRIFYYSIIFSNYQKKKVSVILSKENWSAKDNIVVSGYKIEVKKVENKNFMSII